jgi:hypothetical protein
MTDRFGFLVTLVLIGAVVAAGLLGARWVQKPGYRLRGALVLLAVVIPLVAATAVSLWRAVGR